MDSLQVCWVKRHQNPCGVLPGPKDRDWDPVRLVTQMWRGLGLDGVHPPGRRFAFEVTISWNLRRMCVWNLFQPWEANLTPNFRNTVDGRNAAPVDMVNIPLFTRFYTSQVVSRISSINSMRKVYIFPSIVVTAHHRSKFLDFFQGWGVCSCRCCVIFGCDPDKKVGVVFSQS